jgi:hypothetical protein
VFAIAEFSIFFVPSSYDRLFPCEMGEVAAVGAICYERILKIAAAIFSEQQTPYNFVSGGR